MAHIVMAHIVMAHIVMAYIVMACMVMACIFMFYHLRRVRPATRPPPRTCTGARTWVPGCVHVCMCALASQMRGEEDPRQPGGRGSRGSTMPVHYSYGLHSYGLEGSRGSTMPVHYSYGLHSYGLEGSHGSTMPVRFGFSLPAATFSSLRAFKKKCDARRWAAVWAAAE